jgi:hypothetical protein
MPISGPIPQPPPIPRGPAQAVAAIPRLSTAVNMRSSQLFRKPVIINFFLLYVLKDVMFASMTYKTHREENIGAAGEKNF